MTARDHRDMMASILKSVYAEAGIGITRLMYATEIIWQTLRPLLIELTERNMITSEELPGMRFSTRNHDIYFITSKGIRFLEVYKKLKEEYLRESIA